MEFRKPKYSSADKQSIDCEILIQYEWLPFTASANDPEQRGRDVYAAIVEAGRVAEYEPPPVEMIVKNTIAQIEREYPVTQRAIRELVLTIGQVFPEGQDTVFYQKALAAETLIRAERDKLVQ